MNTWQTFVFAALDGTPLSPANDLSSNLGRDWGYWPKLFCGQSQARISNVSETSLYEMAGKYPSTHGTVNL